MPLDRIISLEEPVISRDTFGSSITTWAPLTQVWAEKLERKGKERFVNDANKVVATRAATWRIRYMPGVTELMRAEETVDKVLSELPHPNRCAELGHRRWRERAGRPANGP